MIELLGFHYTDRCNIECAHCCVSSGPRRRTKMDPAFAADVIQQAHALGIRAIKFTGGEALLYPQEILALTRIAGGLGMRVGAVTNGYWARTVEKGIAFLAPLVEAGLREVDISVDRWHWEFLSPAQVGHAIAAARTFPDLKLVLYRVMKRTERPDDEAFYGELGLTLQDLVLESCNANDSLRQTGRDPGGRVHVRWTYVSRAGRGAGLPDDDTISVPCAWTPSVPCPDVGRAPVLYPDGTLYACCSGKVPAPLHAANLRRESLAATQERMDSNPLLRLIAASGPRRLRDLLGEHRSKLPVSCDSVCDLCKGTLAHVDEAILQRVAGEEWDRMVRSC